MKDGLHRYKYKNSHLRPVGENPSEEKKGAIFTFASKEHMIAARGLVISSLETIEEKADYFSHWTPNVYCFGSYQDDTRRITRGHSEDNLKQLNTFYVDFDCYDKTIVSSDILVASLDLSFMPTAIVKTDRGFQAYFVLSSPAYVTVHSDYKVVKVAKMVSQNIRHYFLKQGLPVDMACNHFGIARLPRADNLEFYEPSYTYSLEEWLWWSMKQETAVKPKPTFSVLSGSQGHKQIDEPWFKLLLGTTAIRGQKALLGRNNAIFTLALACFGSGMVEETCRVLLETFNRRLDEPLSPIEFDKTIKSAYSGRYEAASRDYILNLCRAWISPDLRPSDLFSYQRWYKFKKSRDQRVRSHLWEWEADVLAYLEKISFEVNPFIRTTKAAIIKAVGVPSRSLSKVLANLQQAGKIVYRSKTGRNGGLKIASIMQLSLSVMDKTREAKQTYYDQLGAFLEQSREVLESLADRFNHNRQTRLFECDVGVGTK